MRTNPLKELVQQGCLAITGAEPFVIRSCMQYAKETSSFFLLEATVNQVNQHGGYTGMTPANFARMVSGIATDIGFPLERLVLCGDHLGPFVWRHLPAAEAMKESIELVNQYVAAGFRKIHLDPTMHLADDDHSRPLSNETIAERAAALAIASEASYAASADRTPWTYRPAYVIGSEVPVPGGTTEDEGLQVTRPEDLYASIECFRQAFLKNSLQHVWDDVVAVVAQIGVEFSDDGVHEYDHDAAAALAKSLDRYPSLRFESHSSDYQLPERLQEMVRDRVGILKVGPELTFALREGLFALAFIERELAAIAGLTPSRFIESLEEAMLSSSPNYWRSYYHGSEDELAFKRRYSFSDRSRYYFSHPSVIDARRKLIANLSTLEIPLPLLSQYLPVQYHRVRSGQISRSTEALLTDKVQDVMSRYHTNMELGLGRKR